MFKLGHKSCSKYSKAQSLSLKPLETRDWLGIVDTITEQRLAGVFQLGQNKLGIACLFWCISLYFWYRVLVLVGFLLCQNKLGRAGALWYILMYFIVIQPCLGEADPFYVYFIVFQCLDTGCWYWVYFICVKTKLAERERKQVSSTGISSQAELGKLFQFSTLFNSICWEASIHSISRSFSRTYPGQLVGPLLRW